MTNELFVHVYNDVDEKSNSYFSDCREQVISVHSFFFMYFIKLTFEEHRTYSTHVTQKMFFHLYLSPFTASRRIIISKTTVCVSLIIHDGRHVVTRFLSWKFPGRSRLTFTSLSGIDGILLFYAVHTCVCTTNRTPLWVKFKYSPVLVFENRRKLSIFFFFLIIDVFRG